MKGAAVTIVTGTPVSGTSDQIADLELHHRRRARCEDRIRTARDTSLRNLPQPRKERTTQTRSPVSELTGLMNDRG
jgi:hypothetical protein